MKMKASDPKLKNGRMKMKASDPKRWMYKLKSERKESRYE
jgi:hypothetical protein